MKDPTALSKTQAAVLFFVAEHVVTKGYPPTQAEICNAFGWKSANAAVTHLNVLENKGAISIQHGIARGIKILKAPETA